jgi:hypothetical protein
MLENLRAGNSSSWGLLNHDTVGMRTQEEPVTRGRGSSLKRVRRHGNLRKLETPSKEGAFPLTSAGRRPQYTLTALRGLSFKALDASGMRI